MYMGLLLKLIQHCSLHRHEGGYYSGVVKMKEDAYEKTDSNRSQSRRRREVTLPWAVS
jgi:hypothetical protein